MKVYALAHLSTPLTITRAVHIHAYTVIISSSSDPYIPLEKEGKITRRILEKFVKRNYIFGVVTKSDLVVRDIDLLCKGKCCLDYDNNIR